MVNKKVYIKSTIGLVNKKYSDLGRLKLQTASSITNSTISATANNSNTVRTSLVVLKSKNNLETVKAAVPSTPQSINYYKQTAPIKIQDNAKYTPNAAFAVKQNNITGIKENDQSKRKYQKTGSIEIDNVKILTGIKNVSSTKPNPSLRSVSKRK